MTTTTHAQAWLKREVRTESRGKEEAWRCRAHAPAHSTHHDRRRAASVVALGAHGPWPPTAPASLAGWSAAVSRAALARAATVRAEIVASLLSRACGSARFGERQPMSVQLLLTLSTASLRWLLSHHFLKQEKAWTDLTASTSILRVLIAAFVKHRCRRSQTVELRKEAVRRRVALAGWHPLSPDDFGSERRRRDESDDDVRGASLWSTGRLERVTRRCPNAGDELCHQHNHLHERCCAVARLSGHFWRTLVRRRWSPLTVCACPTLMAVLSGKDPRIASAEACCHCRRVYCAVSV